MPTPTRGRRMGGSSAHQKAILANQASDLFRHGRIKTTEAKAKMLRPYAEKLITKAKNGDLHNRRLVLSSLRNKDVTAYLFEEVAPRFADRDGGYTRILKLGPRQGDSTKMVYIELVDRGQGSGEEAIEESKASRGRGLFGRRKKNAGGVAVAERDETSSASSVASELSESSDAPAAAEASAPEVEAVADDVVDDVVTEAEADPEADEDKS